MKQLSNVLIVADEDIAYGIQKGYYPELTKKVEDGILTIIDYESYQNIPEIQLLSKPLRNGEDVYILNPYTNKYISASDNELLDNLCIDKAYAVKEALVRMGAKRIVVENAFEDIDQLNTEGKTKVGVGSKGQGSLTTTFSRSISLNLKNQLTSEDPDRIPKPYSDVKSFIENNGLSNDSRLGFLLNRMKEDGKLHGKEEYTLEYFNEVSFALNVLSTLNLSLFSSSLDFKLEHNHIHRISSKLSIEF